MNLTLNLTNGSLSMQNSPESTSGEDLNRKYYLNIIAPILWSAIMTFAILGNGLIIYIILKRRLYRNSCTNCYIINVAIADLSFIIICVPFTMAAFMYSQWIFGRFLCKVGNLLMYASVQAACLTLTAMTIDRYSAILYPLKSIDFRTTKLALLINIFIWIASLILNMPLYWIYHYQVDIVQVTDSNNATLKDTNNYKETHLCYQDYGSNGILKTPMIIYTFMISYVLPLSIIVFCYMRMIIKIIRNTKEKPARDEYKQSFTSSYNNNCNSYGEKSSYKGSVMGKGFFRKEQSSINSNSVNKENSLYMNTNGRNYLLNNEDEYDDLSSVRSTGSYHKPDTKMYPTSPSKKQRNSHSYSEAPQQADQFVAKVSFKNKSTTNLSIYSSFESATKPSQQEAKQNSNKKFSKISMAGKSTINVKKQKMKLLFLIATVAIIFATTWLPSHIIVLWMKLFPNSFPYNHFMYVFKFVAHTLTYLNSLINPFIYVFIGAKFRSYIYLEFNKCFQLLTCLANNDKKLAKKKMSSMERNSNYMNTKYSNMDFSSVRKIDNHFMKQTSLNNEFYARSLSKTSRNSDNSQNSNNKTPKSTEF